jgi:hypothetical protein
MMKITSVALVLTFTFVGGASFAASAQQVAPPSAVNELYERYKPRLWQLTPGKIENIWRSLSNINPWFRSVYAILNADRDNPMLVQKLEREIPCAETTALTRDVTYTATIKQYRCTVRVPIPGAVVQSSADEVIYLNLNEINTLESVVIYQTVPAEVHVRQMLAGGTPANEVPALVELHSEIMSRIDNARAPSGSYVEYSKNMEDEKFAARFK